jgi:hypothetical protein
MSASADLPWLNQPVDQVNEVSSAIPKVAFEGKIKPKITVFGTTQNSKTAKNAHSFLETFILQSCQY